MPRMKATAKTFSDAIAGIKMGSPLAMFALFCAVSLNFVTAKEPNLMYFPDETGTTHLISLQDFDLSDQDIEYLRANLSTITFLLYTRNNPTNGYVLNVGDMNNLQKSNWNANHPTRIITHGWQSSAQSSSCVKLRDAYLAVDHFNVILIDWKSIAADILYSKVTASIPSIAVYVSSFLNYMQIFGGLDPRNTIMIGHSLGAHLVSLAARGAATNIAEVVGLDPAGPGFLSKDQQGRIDASHANYVQVIHTNSGKLGLTDNVGTADFYVNGGKSQPGCILDVLGNCAHSRAYEYFAESILRRLSFRAKPVQCSRGQPCPDVYMGGPYLDQSAHGSYVLYTSNKSPYGLG
ncbi:hypothetical protein KPH14_003895 [Odynerus spinipes]|uniref:phospholipase A1 n=1 Tax=Odynerus spinipes TaxID=1348599 RepID=A0AAD9VUR8_9HYME|nr:hypothetical protein KPH14_003895 [Odynerus spinipes]